MKARRKRFAVFRRRLKEPRIGYQHGRRERITKNFILLSWTYYWLTAQLTVRLVLMGVVCFVPAVLMMMLGWDNRAFNLAFAVLAWMVSCMVIGWFSRPRLQVEAHVPTRVECGSAFATQYRVRNLGRRPARSVSLDTLIYPGITGLRIQSAFLHSLASDEEETVSGNGLVRVRGVFTLPAFRWDSDFPCGFWRWGRTDVLNERVLFVYPRYVRLDSFDLPLGNRNRNELSSASELTREAFEFHGCREFRDGDSLRHVHARSSARVGTPVVKEFQTEGRSRTALLIDTRGKWMFGGLREHALRIDPFEAALSVAASIVDYLSTTDRILELLVAGPDVFRFVSAGRVGYLEEVLDILAAVEPMQEDPLEKLKPMLFDEIRMIQSVCLVLTGWDERRRELMDEISAWEIGIKVIVITPFGKRPEGLPGEVVCLSAREVLKGNYEL